MRKILFLIPSLNPSGAARQLALLAPRLPRDQFELLVCVLGTGGLFAEPLRSAGIPIEALSWTRLIDLAPFLRLRRLLRSFKPDVIHVWRPPSLRIVRLFAGRASRVVVSAPLQPHEHGPQLSPLDSLLLRAADRVVAGGQAEAECFRKLGLPGEKITVIPPAVEIRVTGSDEPSPAILPPEVARPDARLLVCAGPLEVHKGFQEAIWATDILKYLYDHLHLMIVGDGPDRERLEQFVHIIGAVGRVHFLGTCKDTAAWLSRAEVVWVPSRAEGGIHVALEAMAAGRPVVASQLPGLAEVVVEGETGFLVPSGDKAALARRTRQLLDHPDQRQRMGEAGRRRVAEHFPPAAMVQRFVELYS
jgi:glycosyltransferase involved in cell wall biosynthesis